MLAIMLYRCYIDSMKALYLRLPDDLHREMRENLAKQSKTAQQTLLPIIELWVQKGCPDAKT